MQFTRSQTIAALSVVFSFLVALLTNVVTSSLPPWIQSYTGLAWLLLLLSLIFLIVTTVRGVAPKNPVSQIDDDLLNYFVQVVSDAESKAQLDPGLEHIPYATGKLAEWKDIDTRLIRILGINEDTEDWQPRRENEQLAHLVLRLTKAIIPSMSQRGQWKDLTELASPTYIIAEALKEWVDATHIAYDLTLTYYDAGSFTKAKFWVHQMEKSLKHINTQSISDGLYCKFFDINGVLLRDYDGDLEKARKYLQDALAYAKRTRNPLMIWRVTTHLGTLEKRKRDFDKASELYEEALKGASQLNDPGLILECYQALGDLAMLQEDPDKPYYWYSEQLKLATASSRMFYKGRAHKGLAESFLRGNQPDAKQAYQHAREALRIEQEITGPNENELLILLVHIADMLWIQP